MAVDQGLREAMPEKGDQRHHGLALLIRPRVEGLPLRVEPTDVAYSYTVGVRRLAMVADNVYRLAYLYGAIQVDDVVIAAVSTTGG